MSAVFLSYSFFFKKLTPFWITLVMFLIALPLALSLPTKYSLIGVTLIDCNAIEGFFAHYYTYITETVCLLSILFMSFFAFDNSINFNRKNEIRFFSIGIILFLLSFSSLNIVGSFTNNWTLAQAGLIGMPIFTAFLSYIIVRFKTFNIKVFGAQILVAGLIFLVASILFARTISSIQIIVVSTLIFILIIGYLLVKSVQREVMQREQLEILTEQLFDANEKLKGLDKLKTEFLSLASHQLRSPLTAIKGYTSMILEGDFGIINPQAKDATERVFQSTMNLTKIVEDFLNVSKIEQGGMKYTMTPFDLVEISKDMTKDLSITAKKKNINLSFDQSSVLDCKLNGDKEKIRQVVLNLIDNAIKYTPENGNISVKVSIKDSKGVFSVTDSGMGVTPEIKATLFQKFSRGEGAKMNTGGSGLGLYLVKEIIEAHKGHTDVDSLGMGKGSTFWFELPLS